MNRALRLTIIGTIVAILYTLFSNAIGETYAIWLQTRFLGLTAFFALFVVVLLGELRLLAKNKGRVRLFRYHKPLAIFSTYVVLLHLITAMADNYKWGKGLSLVDYLGFTFTDQWLIFMSIGTLVFYLMLLIGVTSASKSIRFLGFKRWKIIHYLSYLAFFMAFIHSVNLGTDIKHGIIGMILKPVVIGMFLIVTGLLLTRMLKNLPFLTDQTEVNLLAALILLSLLLFGALLTQATRQEQALGALSSRLAVEETRLAAQERHVRVVNESVTTQRAVLEGLTNG